MRHTSSHTKNRRSHHALSNRVLIKDKETDAVRLPHRVDEKTGMYRGKLIATPKVKKIKNQLVDTKNQQEEAPKEEVKAEEKEVKTKKTVSKKKKEETVDA